MKRSISKLTVVFAACGAIAFAAGCSEDNTVVPSETVELEAGNGPITSNPVGVPAPGGVRGPITPVQHPGGAGGTYTGPGDTVPGAGGPGGGACQPSTCGTYNIRAANTTVDWFMGLSNIQTGVWPQQGPTAPYAVAEYYFTVDDYNTLVASTAPNADGNYTISTDVNSPTQEIYFLDYANAGSAEASVVDGTHGATEVLCQGNFSFLWHHYADPPNCTNAQGKITFSKDCMDTLLNGSGAPGTAVLFVIAYMYCVNDF